MKYLYLFSYKNYYAGDRTFSIVAENKTEAENILRDNEKSNKYIADDCTKFCECEEIDLSLSRLLCESKLCNRIYADAVIAKLKEGSYEV